MLFCFFHFCLDFEQTILKPDHFDAIFYSFGQNGGHLSQPFECDSTTGHISTIWIPDMSAIWIPTVYFKVKLTFQVQFQFRNRKKIYSLPEQKNREISELKIVTYLFKKIALKSSLKKWGLFCLSNCHLFSCSWRFSCNIADIWKTYML